MGITCSGKSKYIQSHFPNAIVIDLFTYQMGKSLVDKDSIMETYQECMNELVKTIKNNIDNDIDIILEHTLLKAIRRKPYIDAVKSVCDIPIIAILINPPMNKLIERSKSRGFRGSSTFIQNNLDVLEIPTIDEGFEKVEIIQD